jgi:hypothetical protein
LGWVGVANNWAITKVFAPRMEQVRRETFEQSKAYNQGQAQQLEQFQFQYIKAAPADRPALATVILESSADYDSSKLPPNLQQFLESLRSERLNQSYAPAASTSSAH